MRCVRTQCERRNNLPPFSRFCFALLSRVFGGLVIALVLLCAATPAKAQSFRFSLRADPDVIPANGISTSSILVQVQNTGGAAISAAPTVRFVTSDGSIESQARLSGGVARVLLRSSTKPGTAIVTAFVGNAREQITVEFSDDVSGMNRYLDLAGSSVSYGADSGIVTASGKCVFSYGDTYIESDIRLDIDLNYDRLWAEGNAGSVLIRQGKGGKAHELRGDRLYYDLRRRRGVIRRIDAIYGPPHQEFMGMDMRPIPAAVANEAAVSAQNEDTRARHDAAITTVIPPDKTPVIDSTSRTTEPVAQIEPPASNPPAPESATEQAAAEQPAIAPRGKRPDYRSMIIVRGQDAASGEADGPSQPAIAPDAAVQPEEASTSQAGITGTAPVVGGSAAPPAPASSPDTAPASADETAAATEQAGLPAGDKPADAAAGPRVSTVYKVDGSRGYGDPAVSGTPVVVGNALREPAAAGSGGEPQIAPVAPSYRPLEAEPSVGGHVFEPPPPVTDVNQGYWVAARKLRVFPHDKIQFEKATLFLNGGKVFSMPRYVVPLNGIFNPGQDMLGFNSSGGLTLNVPFYYQATPNAQGTIYFQHAPGNGFAAEKSGFALALDQQYWLSSNSSGRLVMDQLGRGNWNMSFEHKLQFNPTTVANFSLDMPEHKNAYLRSSLLKDFSSLQIGLETFYSRPDEGQNDFQGQFFARMRPRNIGASNWTYSLSANVAAWQRYPELVEVFSNGGSNGGGVGLPGQTRPTSSLVQQYRPAFSQTLDFSLQAPITHLWKGATLVSTLRATAYNQSIGRRGVSPGLSLGLAQSFGRVGSMQLDYTYDKSGGLFSGTDLTHSISGSLLFTPSRKIGANVFAIKSLSDRSLYASASLDYMIRKKWRIGLFSDYSSFDDYEGLDFFDYGWTLGRMLGRRELTLNWSQQRRKIYFELGGFRL